jgi:RND family efflux transporter MFP subunit
MLRRVLLHFLLPLAILAGAAGIALAMIRNAETTTPTDPEAIIPLVEIAVAAQYEGPVLLSGNGVVEAEREATVSPQIGGRILEVAPTLVDGGRVAAGDLLVRIDNRDYQLALKQQRAQVKRAKLDVEVERSAGDAAEREWKLSGRAPSADARRIAHRVPQLELAQANVEAAEAAVEASKLDLARAVVRAPFNATVVSESVEVGDVVAPGSVMARLIGTDRFIARVSLTVEQLQFVRVAAGDVQGSPVTLTQRLGRGATVVRQGHVLRIVSELDAASRTAQVLIAVESPLDPPAGESPLYVGAFVRADIEGAAVDEGVAIPRQAVFDGNRVWVVNENEQIEMRQVVIAFARDEEVVLAEGMNPGDRVVVTTIPQAIAGMDVRVTESADG